MVKMQNPQNRKVTHEPTSLFDTSEDGILRPKKVDLPEFGISVFESRHAKGFARSQLCENFSKFLFILNGRAQVRSGGEDYDLRPQSLLHIRAQVAHEYLESPAAPITLFALCYKPVLLPSPLRDDLVQSPIRHWCLDIDASWVQMIRSSFRELLYEQTLMRPAWEPMMLSILIRVCVGAVRFDSRLPGPMPVFDSGRVGAERVAEYLSRMETYFYRPQSLDEAAASTGLGRRRFSTLFRNLTGQSWHQRLESLRIQHAIHLLKRSDRSVLAIAFESGFETSASFYRSFKRITGETPQTFRDRL